MAAQQKLLSLWVWLLLMAALFPGAQYVYSKRGGGFKGRGKGDGSKSSSSQSGGLSKQGLRWAGAAAGVLGGTGTGYGLGLFGRPKHGSGNHYGHMTYSEQDQRLYFSERQGHHNQSLWRALVSTATPVPATNILLTLGHVSHYFVTCFI
uniref:Shadow of prion protein 2 n=1 Tax=Echeneis naucrates TaxID=173247 RepID=A0A665VNM9_ECHNA